MSPVPNEDFCRKLCEEFELTLRRLDSWSHCDPDDPDPAAMSALSTAIQIVMEKAAMACVPDGETFAIFSVCSNHCHESDAAAIRSLQLSAEDVRTEEK